jgi:phage baseplate assembly protein W
MSRATGALLTGPEHLAQSVTDILTTPVGSRLARRAYGSRLPDLLDAPVNAATRVRLFAATATALMRWEPRITVQRIGLTAIDAMAGCFALDILAAVTDTGAAVALRVPLSGRGGA